MSYIIVLDCETAPINPDLAVVVPSNMAVYDVGWAIINRQTWEVVETRSYINEDIFFNRPDLMRSAYYKSKVPEYIESIHNHTATVKNLYNIRKSLFEDVATYGIKEIYAHNAKFDVGALNNTQSLETNHRYNHFFPYNVKICDSLKMSRSVIATKPSYQKFCFDNGYMTKHSTPRPRLTAEILYRFITNEMDFEEHHKGLDDVLIEKEIVRYCYRQHRKMDKFLEV